MIKKSKLPIYTFLAVFFAMVLVGVVAIPLILDVLQKNYYRLQADVNQRQAKSMAQFLMKRLEQGADEATVIQEFQASIAGSEMDLGYVCLVDQGDAEYLSHPMQTAIGMNVSLKNAFYDADFDGQDLIKWEDEIMNGQSGGGLLHYSDNPSEIVYFYDIPGVNWTISSHENAELIQSQMSTLKTYVVIGSVLFGLLLALPVSFAVRRVSRGYEKQIELEQEKSEQLLLNVLPPSIADRMKLEEHTIVDHYPDVSVLFCDIAGFTAMSAQTEPHKLVSLLNVIFSRFDAICDAHGVEKIKTIGDAYMAVGGVPQKDSRHAYHVAEAALRMMEEVHILDPKLNVRIGLHSGEVVAGVIGTTKFSYDLWGDTVNTASRLESHGALGRIHCSKAFKDQIDDEYVFEERGNIELKGKGVETTYFLVGVKN